MRKIRVLVVDDSMLFRNLLVQSLSEDPCIEVVAQAGDAYAARDAILKYRPDVMTLDVEMPRMGGIEFLRKLLPQYPLPVVVISAMDEKVFDAMEAGAVLERIRIYPTGKGLPESYLGPGESFHT